MSFAPIFGGFGSGGTIGSGTTSGHVYAGHYVGSSANLDIPLTSSGFAYEIIGALVPITDGAGVEAWFTNDNFATVENGSFYYDASSYASGTSYTYAGSGSTKTTSMTVANNIGNATGESWIGALEVLWPHDANRRTGLVMRATNVLSSGNIQSPPFTGLYDVAEAVNGIRLAATSGNLGYDLYVFARKA